MVGEACRDEREDVAGDLVRGEHGSRWHHPRSLRREGFSILGVVVPRAALGLPLRCHEDPEASALFAIEVLHAERAALTHMRRELAHRAEEVAVFADLQRDIGLRGHPSQRLQHPPVAGRRHQEGRRFQPHDIDGQLIGERATTFRVVERGVVDHTPGGAHLGRTVAHGGQENGGALLAAPDVCGFLGDLSHPHRIEERIEPVESARLEVELVAEHDHQIADGLHGTSVRPSRTRGRAGKHRRPPMC